MGQTKQQVLVVPHGYAKPGSDVEGTKETARGVIAGEEHFIFSVCSVVGEHNEVLHFVSYSAGLRHPGTR